MDIIIKQEDVVHLDDEGASQYKILSSSVQQTNYNFINEQWATNDESEDIKVKCELVVLEELYIKDEQLYEADGFEPKTLASRNSCKCTICKKKYSRKDTLKGHLKLHVGEEALKCRVCNYQCSQKRTLNQHMRMHTGEKPFQCTVCDYRSSTKSYLSQHMRTHTGEKPFQCDVCKCRCSTKTTLRRHIKTHTGEKPFQCNLCDYKSFVKNH